MNLVCSNFSYKDGELDIEPKPIFYSILLANQDKTADIIEFKKGTDDMSITLNKKWLGLLDKIRSPHNSNVKKLFKY